MIIKIKKINEMVLKRISYLNNLKSEYLTNQAKQDGQDDQNTLNN